MALSGDNLTDTPEWNADPFGCNWCLYWEHPELPADQTEDRDGALRGELERLRRVGREFEAPGKLIYVYGKPVGYAAYPTARSSP